MRSAITVHFLDVSTVGHEKLLKKLESYGFWGQVFDFLRLRDYLFHRGQIVGIDGFRSLDHSRCSTEYYARSIVIFILYEWSSEHGKLGQNNEFCVWYRCTVSCGIQKDLEYEGQSALINLVWFQFTWTQLRRNMYRFHHIFPDLLWWKV